MQEGAAAAHHIVIVGGGAAGVELATQLGRRARRTGSFRVTLVDCKRTHLWKPLLHSVAAGSLDPGAHEIDYLAQAHWSGFVYRLGELVALNRRAKTIDIAPTLDDSGRPITPMQTLSYDTLILAVGSVTNDFGTPGAAKYAVPLETAEQAAKFNRLLINACIRADAQEGPVRPGQLHVAIIGAGATGTELSAELHRTVNEIVAFGLHKINPTRDLRIVLIEASDRILPALSPRISAASAALLSELGVDMRVNARVDAVRADGVELRGGEFIPAELVVWCAGVKGPKVLASLDGLEVNRAGQLVVKQTLQTTVDPDVFAIGDCAACPRPGFSNPVPPRAQAAHQQATHMLRQIARRLRGEELAPFVYRDFGSLVSLGDYGAAGNLMGFLAGRGLFVEGLIARSMYRSLYLRHQIAIYGALRALLGTVGRTFSRRAGPQVKLH